MTATAPDEGPADGPDLPYHIRQAEPADLLAVHRIEQRSFPQPWPYAAFQGFVGERAFLVAEHRDEDASVGDHLAGYVVADVMPNYGDDIGHVKDIAVAPDHRGRGLGRTLLSRALMALAGQGAGTVKLEVRASNEPALGLYRSFGFELRRRIPRYYDDGEDALVMVRALG